MRKIMDYILPTPITNHYQGHSLAKWVFVLITIVTIIRSIIHIVALDGGAQSIATIPLQLYSSAASDTIIMLFALWGLSQLLVGLMFVVVLFRYQALIPAMYGLLIIEYTTRILIGVMKPIETVGTAPGGVANYVIVPVALLMFIMSLRQSELPKSEKKTSIIQHNLF